MKSDKTAIIIIAAGSGMGAATARKLAANGYHVGLLSSSGKAEALAEELGGIGITGTNHNQADIQKLVDLVMERWGRVDVLVNSAGKGPRAPVLELTDADWHAGIDAYLLNIVRAARCVTACHGEPRRRGNCQYLQRLGVEPADLFPTSAVARAGLASFTKLFVDEYARHGVRMNNVLRLDQQPARKRRAPRGRAHAALRHGGRDCSHDCFLGQRGRCLHQRPEPARAALFLRERVPWHPF